MAGVHLPTFKNKVIFPRVMGIEQTTNQQEELFRIRGYVYEIVPDGRIEVMVMDAQGQKKLSMPIKPFQEQGILGQDTGFIYRVYRQGGKVYSEVLPDDSLIETRPIAEDTLKMLADLERLEEQTREV
jgi:hypothetical protein